MKQLSVFLPNEKGALSKITSLLTKGGIDLKAMTLADTPDYGILRMIVSDIKKATELLRANEIIASETSVTVVRIPHEVGSLSAILTLLENNGVNIEYMYAFTGISGTDAYAVFRFESKMNAQEILSSNGIPIYMEEDL